MSGTDWSDVGVTGLLPTGTVTLAPCRRRGVDSAVGDAARRDDSRDRAGWIAPSRRSSRFMVACGPSSRARATASSSRSRALPTRWHVRSTCSAAPLAPIRLRIGVHTGEVQLRDEGNYVGPTVNRTARLRDLAHGGQTVLSAATEQMVVDWLPADAWLTDLGAHKLRDVPRPERVMQLCHPDLCE